MQDEVFTAVKIQVVDFWETILSYHIITQCHNPENYSVNES
jgi:hypothetical protein